MLERGCIKLAKWALTMLLITYVGFYGIYTGFYWLVNTIDYSIYNRYASSNKFDKNIYFNEDIENKTHIFLQICEIKELKVLLTNPIKQISYRCMNDNIDKIRNIMNKNEAYLRYLEENDTSVNDAMKFIKKMAYLDDKVLQMDIYLVFLIMCICTVGLFKYRKSFYIIAGITYLIVMASNFSDGLSDYIVTNVINIITKLQSDVFTYQNMEYAKSFYTEAFKESMMTFIIFDTILQIFSNKNSEKKQYQMRYVFESLNVQINFLVEQGTNDDKYVGRISCNTKLIYKECDRKIKELKKRQKLYKNTYQLECWIKLRDNIDILAKNYFTTRNTYSTKEYVQFLRHTRDCMIKCHLL